jgi:hypothetical protein
VESGGSPWAGGRQESEDYPRESQMVDGGLMTGTFKEFQKHLLIMKRRRTTSRW